MQSLFPFKGTPTIFQQSFKFGHSRSICGKEIADGTLSFTPQRCFDHSSISTIKSEGNRRERPRRSTNRMPKETDRSKEFPTSDEEAPKSSNQDAIIALFKRIQSSISKDGSVSSERNLKSQRDKTTSRSMRQNQKHKRISDTPPRKDYGELSEGRGNASEAETISNAPPHVDAKVARPASNFVKRSPIPQPPTTNETSSNQSNEPPNSDVNNINQMKLPQLKELAREKGLKGYSKMKKGELLELLKGLLSESN